MARVVGQARPRRSSRRRPQPQLSACRPGRLICALARSGLPNSASRGIRSTSASATGFAGQWRRIIGGGQVGTLAASQRPERRGQRRARCGARVHGQIPVVCTTPIRDQGWSRTCREVPGSLAGIPRSNAGSRSPLPVRSRGLDARAVRQIGDRAGRPQDPVQRTRRQLGCPPRVPAAGRYRAGRAEQCAWVWPLVEGGRWPRRRHRPATVPRPPARPRAGFAARRLRRSAVGGSAGPRHCRSMRSETTDRRSRWR